MDENKPLNRLYPEFCKVIVVLAFIIVGICAMTSIFLGILDYLIAAQIVSPLQL